jgi:hypothetical protein
MTWQPSPIRKTCTTPESESDNRQSPFIIRQSDGGFGPTYLGCPLPCSLGSHGSGMCGPHSSLFSPLSSLLPLHKYYLPSAPRSLHPAPKSPSFLILHSASCILTSRSLPDPPPTGGVGRQENEKLIGKETGQENLPKNRKETLSEALTQTASENRTENQR